VGGGGAAQRRKDGQAQQEEAIQENDSGDGDGGGGGGGRAGTSFGGASASDTLDIDAVLDDCIMNSQANADNAKAIAPLLVLAAQDMKTNGWRKKMELDNDMRGAAADLNMSVHEDEDGD
jgi:hypothetical protein